MATVAVIVSSAMLGCSTGGREATKTIQVSMDDILKQSAIVRDTTLSVGNTLKVALGSNHTTPYRWTADPEIGDSTIVRQTSHEYVRPNTDRMGAPGTDVWIFTATKTGTTTIVMRYAGIVGSDTSPVCTFTAKVTVW
nr:protease inhibitor I42 family protein [Mycobacterium lacus]